jgi:hypothetical protein
MALFSCVKSTFAAGRADGAFLNTITDNYVTPHLDWAKPLAGGPPKVLFITPRKAAREVVELCERMDIDRQAVLTYNPSTMALNNVYESLVSGTSMAEKTRELQDKINGDYNAIVLANVDWKVLPLEVQYKILRKVADGAGLLIVYPRGFSNPKYWHIPRTIGRKLYRWTTSRRCPE